MSPTGERGRIKLSVFAGITCASKSVVIQATNIIIAPHPKVSGKTKNQAIVKVATMASAEGWVAHCPTRVRTRIEPPIFQGTALDTETQHLQPRTLTAAAFVYCSWLFSVNATSPWARPDATAAVATDKPFPPGSRQPLDKPTF